MQTNEQFRVYNAEGLGLAIRHFREKAGLTQAQLAERLGIQRPYLSELEEGKITEQTQRIINLLKVLGVRIIIQKADW